MKTFMANEQNISRKWYVVDATGMVMGRLASQVAAVLRGKNKPTYTPHVDTGDHVIIINAGKAVLTGNKLIDKYYRTHSGYVGGLKETQYKTLMAKKPCLAMKLAIKGMLPKNSIGRWSLLRCKIYEGEQHDNAAQKPEMWAE